jgi:hypothetical protein
VGTMAVPSFNTPSADATAVAVLKYNAFPISLIVVH